MGEDMFHGEAILCLCEITLVVLCTDVVVDAAIRNLFALLFEKRQI